ncbi:phosphoribosylanthranilate isomerase [soil metagenome]
MLHVAERAAAPAIKICGVCRATDAAYATSAGATCIGVILAPGRSRTRTLSQAAVIFDAASASRVGVFVDASAAEVLGAAERLRLDVVQLHGDEPPATVEAIAREQIAQVWKARRVRDAADVATAVREYDGAHGLLRDGWSPHAHGGVGASFDWSAIAPLRASVPPKQRLILAGGLRPDNVASAIELLTPDIVDVSSGVEAEPGRKSTDLIDAFIAAVRGAKDGI